MGKNSRTSIHNSNKMCGGQARKLESQAREKLGPLRRPGTDTREQILTQIGVITRQFAAYGPRNIEDIKTKHVDRLFADLAAGKHTVLDRQGNPKQGEPLSPGTLANYARTMRDLAEALGKPQIVRDNAALGALRDDAERTKHAGKEVNDSLWNRISSQVKEWQSAAMGMVRAFGLRAEESLRSHKVVKHEGVPFLIIEGAKGGRPNEKPILLPEQRAALDRVQEIRKEHGGTLAPIDKTLSKACRSLENAVSYRGGSIEAGANLHAGRRQELIERCEQAVADYKATGDKQQYDADLKSIAEWAGHGRTEVLAAYCKILKS